MKYTEFLFNLRHLEKNTVRNPYNQCNLMFQLSGYFNIYAI